MTHRGVTFGYEDVRLDGQRFEDCTIQGTCRLLYEGGPLPEFAECRLEHGLRLLLDGPAARTCQFLAAIYHEGGDGGRETVERLFNELRDGSTWLRDGGGPGG
jgi:hypothetical protein